MQPGTVPTPVVATEAQAAADPEQGGGKKAKKEKAPSVNYFSLFRCRQQRLRRLCCSWHVDSVGDQMLAQCCRHADRTDWVLITLGCIGAIANGEPARCSLSAWLPTAQAHTCWPRAGAALPMFTLVFGSTLNAVGGTLTNVSAFNDKIKDVCLDFTWLALGASVAGYGQLGMWMWTCELAPVNRPVCSHIMHSWLTPTPCCGMDTKLVSVCSLAAVRPHQAPVPCQRAQAGRAVL